MADFYQNGVVTTLHNLASRSTEALEAELLRFSQKRPMALILPSLFSELEGPALGHIVDELTNVPYLSEIVIGLDRANLDQYRHAQGFFSRLPQHHRILWNDGPRLKAIDEELQHHYRYLRPPMVICQTYQGALYMRPWTPVYRCNRWPGAAS